MGKNRKILYTALGVSGGLSGAAALGSCSTGVCGGCSYGCIGAAAAMVIAAAVNKIKRSSSKEQTRGIGHGRV